MPKRIEPKSEVVFRIAKPRERPYLIADGSELALRIWPDGSKRGYSAIADRARGRKTFSASAPTLRLRSIEANSWPPTLCVTWQAIVFD